ncbi:MAG: NADP-dependent oxidoreductase [Candidatus Eremiobacteraeota bacterium]|nr:NADP-dependent oxidoreductase [Candidatus Eremiobacteraeota bacterium]
MTGSVNRRLLLRRRPEGRVTLDDFTFARETIPQPNDGEAVVRVLFLSIDPTNRIWMTDVDQYMPPVAIGDVMRGAAIGVVTESRSARYPAGAYVSGLLGWQDYALVSDSGPSSPNVLPATLPVPLSAMLGVCGLTGVTAYFGLLDIGKPKSGDTVVISAAAGAVGSIVGQIALLHGCRTVGIAGGPEKCAWLRALGFHAAIDYKAHGWRDALAEATPNGIDVYFENVGGEIMDAAFERLALRARVVLCGFIANYNSGTRADGNFTPLLMKRARAEGFIISDYRGRWLEAVAALAGWVAAGKIRYRETIVDGLERSVDALNMLFDGTNLGKVVVRVAEPDASAP